MRHGGLQALVAQGALGLAQIPLGEFRADKAPKVVRLDLRQPALQGILAHRPPGRHGRERQRRGLPAPCDKAWKERAPWAARRGARCASQVWCTPGLVAWSGACPGPEGSGRRRVS